MFYKQGVACLGLFQYQGPRPCDWAGCCCAEVSVWSHGSCWPGPHVCLTTLPGKPRSACNATITLSNVGLIWSKVVLSRFSVLSEWKQIKIRTGQNIMNKNVTENQNHQKHFGLKPQTIHWVESVVKWWEVSNVTPWERFIYTKWLLDLIRFQHNNALSGTYCQPHCL